MARLDWDRETREARKRKHGVTPAWADPTALSYEDEQFVRQLLQPMVDLLDEFSGLSRTQQRYSGSEIEHRLSQLKRQVESELSALHDRDAREHASRRAELLTERF